MPFPNGRPTVDEIEAEATRELEAAASFIDAGEYSTAALRAAIGQAYATLVVAAQVERLVDALPGAGRGS
jgi:hypothetical protein